MSLSKKVKGLVLLAVLAAPGLGLRAGGMFSSCRKKRVLPLAAVTALALTGLALQGRQLETKAPAGGRGKLPAAGASGGAAVKPVEAPAATASAETLVLAEPSRPPRSEGAASAWKWRWKTLPMEIEQAKIPELLRQFHAQPLAPMVRAAQGAYPVDLATGDRPKAPCTQWLGRQLTQDFPRAWPASATSAGRQAALLKAIEAMDREGGFAAHRDSVRQLVAEFRATVSAALEAHRGSSAPGRDVKLAEQLLEARNLKLEAIDPAILYYAEALDLLLPTFLDLQDGRFDARQATFDRYLAEFNAFTPLLEGAAEDYQHHVLPLILRLLPLDSPWLDEIHEELFEHGGIMVPSLLEHVAEYAPGENLDDRLQVERKH